MIFGGWYGCAEVGFCFCVGVVVCVFVVQVCLTLFGCGAMC